MKKFFYLMISVAVAMAAASCEKEKSGNDSTGQAVAGTVPASAVAGTDVTVGGSFLEGDKFYMLKEKDSQTGRVDLTVNKILESGAIVKLSYHTGKYFMYVDRDANASLLGEIKVEITGLSVPESAVAGEKISISGNGFNPEGKLFAKPASGDDIDLKSSYADGTVTATLPEDMAAGTYSLYYQQEPDCNYTLTEAFVVSEPKPVVKGKKLASFGIPDMGTYSLTYTEDGELATFDGSPVTIDGSKYSFKASSTDMDGYEVEATYTYELEDGKVKTITAQGNYLDNGDPYEATLAIDYDKDGHMTDFAGLPMPWENGNYLGETLIYGDSPVQNNPLAKYDAGILSEAILMLPGDIVPAMLMGLCGTPSKDLPSQLVAGQNEDGSLIREDIQYTFDSDGYLTSMSLGSMGLVLEFTYVE